MKKLNDDQRLVLDILNQCEFNNENKIITNYKNSISNQITDQKRLISAYQFGAFITKEVEKYGKEAMQVDLAFSEEELLNDNLELIKKLTNSSNIKIVPYDEKTKPKTMKNAPLLAKPVFICDN